MKRRTWSWVSLNNGQREGHILQLILPTWRPRRRDAERLVVYSISRIQIPRAVRTGTVPQARPARDQYAHYQNARVP